MAQSTQKPTPTTNFEKFLAVTDFSLTWIYGPTRGGKTTLAVKLAIEALQKFKPEDVHYVDGERNVTAEQIAKLGKAYHPLIGLDKIFNFMKKPPKGKLIVIDSPTLAMLGKWHSLKQDGQGRLMQELHEATWYMKEWSAINEALGVIIGQDKSELGKYNAGQAQGSNQVQYWQDPFGGKAAYMSKEIFRLVPTRKHYTGTSSMLMAHDCRRYGRLASIADILINDKGLTVNWRVNPASAAPAPPGISDMALVDFKITLSEAFNEEALDEIRDSIPWNTLTKEQQDELKNAGAKRREELKKANSDGAAF